jgi:alpha-tubulin suppressor-like RCC1 family protein
LKDYFTLSQFRAQQITAKDIRTSNLYTVEEMKTAGYRIQEFLNPITGGYPIIELAGNFPVSEFRLNRILLKTILETASSYYTFNELVDGGYRISEFVQNEFSIAIISSRFSLQDIKNAKISIKRIIDSGVFTISQLIEVGFTFTEMINQRIPLNLLKNYFFSSLSELTILLLQNRFSIQLSTLRTQNLFEISEYKNLDYKPLDLIQRGGFTINNLYPTYSVSEIKSSINNTNRSLQLFRLAGIALSELYPSYSLTELYSIRSTSQRVSINEFKTLFSDGLTALTALKNANIPLSFLKNGFTIPELKEASFTLRELIRARINLNELAPYYSVSDFKNIGVNINSILQFYSILELKNSGYSFNTLVSVGRFTLEQFVGLYLLNQLRTYFKDLSIYRRLKTTVPDKAFTDLELKNSGFSLNQFIKAGYNFNEIYPFIFNFREIKALNQMQYLLLNTYNPFRYITSCFTSNYLMIPLYNENKVLAYGSFDSGKLGNKLTIGSTNTGAFVLNSDESFFTNVRNVFTGFKTTFFIVGFDNSAYYTGVSPINGTSVTSTPLPVIGLNTDSILKNVVKVVSSKDHHLFLLGNGRVVGLGKNHVGQLGNGTLTSYPSRPIYVKNSSGSSDLLSVTDICVNENTSYCISNTYLYSFGYGVNGELGNNTIGGTKRLPVFTFIGRNSTRLSNVISNIKKIVSTGKLLVYLLNNGRVRLFGDNTGNIFGVSSLTQLSYSFPLLKQDGTEITNIIDIAAGKDFILFLNSSKQLLSCGKNTYGQLCDGTTIDCNYVKQVNFPNYILGISAGESHGIIYAINKIYTFGLNNDGQLGNGTNTNSSIFSAVKYSGNDISKVYTVETLALNNTLLSDIQSTSLYTNSELSFAY